MAWLKGLPVGEGLFNDDFSFALPGRGGLLMNKEHLRADGAVRVRVVMVGPRYDEKTGALTLKPNQLVVAFSTQDGDQEVVDMRDIEWEEHVARS
jgi:hypothetical protein